MSEAAADRVPEGMDAASDVGPSRRATDTPAAGREPVGRRALHALVGRGSVVPLATAHGLAAAGDAFVAVSLAGSLFFNVSPNASRQQVLLYLVITMAPLAVLSPLVGPAVDRFRRSQRFVAMSFYVARGLFCLLLAATLLQLAFYPIALGLLIASKASGIVKQTLVQTLVDDPEQLVATNARVARLASVAAAVAVAAASGVFALGGAEWSLRAGSVLFFASAVIVVRARARRSVPVTPDEVEYAETHLPTVVVSAVAMLAIRAAVGFFIFTLAFTLRRGSEPTVIYGVAAASYGVGAFVGHSAAAVLRRWFREEQLIGLALLLPAVLTAVGILGASVPMLVVISGLVGLSTTLGRNAFDGLLQRRAPEALLGRAGAKYETRFQLAWVIGGVLATPISLPVEVSMMVLTAMYVPALVIFVRGLREARRVEHPEDHLGGAHVRLTAAHQALGGGSLRIAVVEASAAVDLAQSVVGDVFPRAARCELDELRRRAIDVEREVSPRDVARAVALADQMIRAASPQSRRR